MTAVVACGLFVPAGRCLARPPDVAGPVDLGLALHGALGSGRAGDLAGGGFGADAHLSVFPTRSRLGLRVQGATAVMEQKETGTEGYILWWPIALTLTTGHSISWAGAGPVWRGRPDRIHGVFYVLLGRGQVSAMTAGGAVNLSTSEFPASQVPIVVVGAGAIVPHLALPRLGHDVAVEFGLEILRGGECTFYGRPPIVSDGAGNYSIHTERAPLAMVAVRCGLTWSPGSPGRHVNR